MSRKKLTKDDLLKIKIAVLESENRRLRGQLNNKNQSKGYTEIPDEIIEDEWGLKRIIRHEMGG